MWRIGLVARTVVSVALATISAVPFARAAGHSMTFKSVGVDLPFGNRTFPIGPGSEATANNCLACHSAGMILSQPPLPRSTWQTEVEKMRAVYKARIPDEDVKPIVDYLARIKGPN